MKPWRWLLLLIFVAAVAAFGWHWIAVDPGLVFVRIRGVRITTTVVFAIVALLVIWFLLGALWFLLRWPFDATTRRQRRQSRRRFSDGIVALFEGRNADAERDLARASRYEPLRAASLLGAAEAASRRGEKARAIESLDQAAQITPATARIVRARLFRLDGRPQESVALLAADADSRSLPPAGWVELAESSVLAGDTRRARDCLEPLQKSGVLSTKQLADLENRILQMAIARAPDGAALTEFWSQLPKNQRRSAAVVDAYARRAAGFGQNLAAMDEVESSLRREWSSSLAATYGALGVDDIETRMRRAEGWLDAHPNDASLLTTLGRMCVRLKLWGKARAYLERALALAPDPLAWEALGDTCVGQGETSLAHRCYRNALAIARGEAAEPLPAVHASRIDTRPVAVEERDVHGVPRLPK
ncbi:heme biosynthesis HemY N-terminal domain-containing protein [Pinirhizobacter sp.]|jgi:HemY protein|uniref:heme biosynthesis HemY N-terminal domain-containing protein n=1 Tax=Pinirhizobacter sp. TaxID=2950432 RepID=UPI002F4161A4